MWPAFAHNVIHCFLDYLLCRQSLGVACLPKIHSDGVEAKSCSDMQGIITPFIKLSLLQSSCGFQATAHSMVHITLL